MYAPAYYQNKFSLINIAESQLYAPIVRGS